MSPDTPDSERAGDGPGDAARPPAGADSSPRPDRPTDPAPGVGATPARSPDGREAPDRSPGEGEAPHRSPGEGEAPHRSPGEGEAPGRPPAGGEAPPWPGGLPVPAGTPITAPGADPLAGYPGVVGAVPGTPSASRRGGGRAAAVALGAALLLTVLGAPLGLLWALVAPGTPVQMTADGAVYATPQPEQPIAADGWFSLLGLGFGVLASITLWVVLRRRRGPAGLLAGALGGLGAAIVAWQVGRRIGLGAYQRLLDTAPPGTDFTKPADLRAGGIDWYGPLPVPHGNLLLAAFGAAVTYTLLAGWSRWPSLRPEPEWDGGWAPGGPGISSEPGDQPAR